MPSIDVTTFLTMIYTMIDDWYQLEAAPHKPVRPGPKPCLSDSEVVTLALLREWLGTRSEALFLALVARHWHGFFPRLIGQSSFNRRERDLWGVLSVLAPLAGRWVSALQEANACRIVDGVAVPLMRVCRGRRHRVFGPEADIGIGGSDKDLYYGVKLLLEITQQGAITGFILGPAATDERWLFEALLRYRCDPGAAAPTELEARAFLGMSHKPGGGRVGPTGPIGPRLGVGAPAPTVIGDLGFSGAAWQQHWHTAYGTEVLTKDAYLTDQGKAAFSRHRQLIETVNGLLVEHLHLAFPKVRTLAGLYARIAAKVATLNLVLLSNLLHHRPTFAQPGSLVM
jgi:hypothetical protein